MKNRLCTFLLFGCSILLFTACAVVNETALSKVGKTDAQDIIQEHISTKDEIKNNFGDAKKIVFDESGLEIWIYRQHNISAATINHILQYVPLVPIIAGSAEIFAEKTKTELVILFDADGVVKKYRLLQM